MIYDTASILPVASYNLVTDVSETSGLIFFNNQIWTHNDSDNPPNLYTLDTLNGNLIQTYPLTGTINNDWEEISQDNAYVYVGDFGNNANGNRTDLKILRIEKNSLLLNSPIIDTINFSYSNQTDFTATGSDKTDFDCEALIVTADSIYLFNKQWVSQKTSLYSLAKTPGTYIANYKMTYDVQGLITGATYIADKRIVVLTGYSTIIQPFLYLLYDFTGNDYFGANKRKVSVSLPFHQVEGIATTNGLKYYISNEYLTYPPYLTIPQQLHIIDLSPFLAIYLDPSLSVSENEAKRTITVTPVPANDFISVMTDQNTSHEDYIIYNQLGKVVLSGKLTGRNTRINISELSAGMYLLKVGTKNNASIKVIKK